MSCSTRSSFALLILLIAITLCLVPAVGSKSKDAKLCSNAVATPEGTSCGIRCLRADPVCGADGVTYGCGCPDAHCAGTTVVKRGPCHHY